MPNTIITADVLDGLAQLPDDSVHVVVTSPPYWALRDYGVEGQLGLESTPELYLERMTAVFREVRRVLRKDGVCFLNIGDSYTGSNNTNCGGNANFGSQPGRDLHFNKQGFNLKPKDLCMMPARLALALQADGWWIRSDIIWAKPNPMPESVTDRPTKSHEFVYMLTKSARYYYDIEATREPHQDRNVVNGVYVGSGTSSDDYTGEERTEGLARPPMIMKNREYNPSGRNARTVWNIATYPFADAHFATYPPALVERCLLAALPKKGVCPKCGAGWERVVESEKTMQSEKDRRGAMRNSEMEQYGLSGGKANKSVNAEYVTIGFRQACTCEPAESVPATVLDPFSGSGTTGVVALQMGANYIGVELNPEYAGLARRRIEREAGGLFE